MLGCQLCHDCISRYACLCNCARHRNGGLEHLHIIDCSTCLAPQRTKWLLMMFLSAVPHTIELVAMSSYMLWRLVTSQLVLQRLFQTQASRASVCLRLGLVQALPSLYAALCGCHCTLTDVSKVVPLLEANIESQLPGHCRFYIGCLGTTDKVCMTERSQCFGAKQVTWLRTDCCSEVTSEAPTCTSSSQKHKLFAHGQNSVIRMNRALESVIC